LTRRRWSTWSVAAALVMGCASSHVGEGFVRAKGAGDRAYSSGRYDEAASAYEDASRRASRAGDRSEALYLQASAYRRARSWDRARASYQRLIAQSPTSDRGRRASFDLADLDIEVGTTESGYQALRDALFRFPNDGLARRAFERYVAHLDASGGALTWLRGALPRLASTELDETARYALAGHLATSGAIQEARDAYLACAERHPYPRGSLFDDALWQASLLDEKLGRPEQAIVHLRRMLAVRESSSFLGSYERPRFSPAQFRIAVLYRDALRDHAAARREFHQLYASHRTSILRDDALWEEAKLARADGDASGACSLVATLIEDFPDSRYAPCARALCASAPATPAGECHGYLLRERRDSGSD